MTKRILTPVAEGMFKNVRPARPQPVLRAERTLVREHEKLARTLLAAFFNIPTLSNLDLKVS